MWKISGIFLAAILVLQTTLVSSQSSTVSSVTPSLSSVTISSAADAASTTVAVATTTPAAVNPTSVSTVTAASSTPVKASSTPVETPTSPPATTATSAPVAVATVKVTTKFTNMEDHVDVDKVINGKKGSEEWNKLEKLICEAIKAQNQDTKGCELLSVKKGSIIAEYELKVEAKSQEEANDFISHLKKAVESGKLGNFTTDPESFKAEVTEITGVTTSPPPAEDKKITTIFIILCVGLGILIIIIILLVVLIIYLAKLVKRAAKKGNP